MQGGRHVHRLAGIAHALEVAFLDGIGLPPAHAGDIELVVDLAEARPHGARSEVQREEDDAALGDAAIDGLHQHGEDAALAIGQTDGDVLERSPLGGGVVGQPTRGVVEIVRGPADRGIVGGGDGVAVRSTEEAVEAALTHQVDAVDRGPVALVVAVEQRIAVATAHAIGFTQAGAVAGHGAAVLADLEHAALGLAGRAMRVVAEVGALAVVEVAVLVGLQVQCEFMVVLGDRAVGVEAFVEVGFAIAIEVLQPHQAVAAGDIDGVIDDAQAQRLEQTGGEALPGDLLEAWGDAADDPDVAIHGRYGSSAVLEEVMAGQAHVGLGGIDVGDGDGVDDVGTGLLAEDADGLQGIAPAALAAFGQGMRIAGGFQAGQGGLEGGQAALGAMPDQQFDGRSRGRDGQRQPAIGAVEGAATDHAGDGDIITIIDQSQAIRRADGRTGLLGDEQGHRLAVAGDGERTGQGVGLARLDGSRHFQDFGGADRIGQHDLVAIEVEAVVVGPIARQIAEMSHACVSEVVAARLGPAGGGGGLADGLAIDGRLTFNAVAACRVADLRTVGSVGQADQFRIEQRQGRALVIKVDGDALGGAQVRRLHEGAGDEGTMIHGRVFARPGTGLHRLLLPAGFIPDDLLLGVGVMHQGRGRNRCLGSTWRRPQQSAACLTFTLDELEQQRVLTSGEVNRSAPDLHAMRAAVVDDLLAIDGQARAVVGFG